jgi:hypothetical protein
MGNFRFEFLDAVFGCTQFACEMAGENGGAFVFFVRNPAAFCNMAISARTSVTSPYPRRTWTINGVQKAPADVVRVAGLAGTFEEAQAQLQQN